MKKKSGAILICLMGLLSFTACGAAKDTTVNVPGTMKVENIQSGTIRVESSEKVSVVPDVADLDFGIVTQDADARSCQEQNALVLEQVTKAIREAGVKDTAIQTSGLNLNPIYDWENGNQIKGYEMTASLTVSGIGIDMAGELITKCTKAGANRLNSVAYRSSTYGKSYEEALQKAVEAAKQKAGVIAKAGGRTISELVKVEEYQNNQTARYDTGAAKLESAQDKEVNLEPGQIEINAGITAEFSLE